MDEPGSKIVRGVADPILSAVRVGVALPLAELSISGSQLPIELPLPPPSGMALFRRRRVGIGRVMDGFRVNVGLLMVGCGPVSSSAWPRVASIGGATIGFSVISSLSGTRLVWRGFRVGGIIPRVLGTRGST